jgi:hypothetical protein
MSVIDGGTVIEGAHTREKQVRVQVTSAELLALFATPISVLSAPGAGFAHIFKRATIAKPAGTAYAGIAGGEDLSFKYTNASGLALAGCETTGFLDQTSVQVREVFAYTQVSGISQITPVDNAAVVIHLLVAEIITGNTPLNIDIFYDTVRTVV